MAGERPLSDTFHFKSFLEAFTQFGLLPSWAVLEGKELKNSTRSKRELGLVP
jgi:hypothetical protein